MWTQTLSVIPFVTSRILPFQFRSGNRDCCFSHLYIYTCNRRQERLSISANLNDSGETKQLNLSVLRFTLGIQGLDESYLPRWIGYVFGSLIILNHLFGLNSTTTTAQLRSEALGLSLAVFSISLPYLGKFLKGATLVDELTLPIDNTQIFAMSANLSDAEREDLAWGTYVLLRNTKTISVLISVRDALCVRGYWNSPRDASKAHILEWFQRQIEQIGLSDLNDSLYFPQSTDSVHWEMLPEGTHCLLVQPVVQAPANELKKKVEGFVLLASSMSYAYSDKDRAWIGAVANKFRG